MPKISLSLSLYTYIYMYTSKTIHRKIGGAWSSAPRPGLWASGGASPRRRHPRRRSVLGLPKGSHAVDGLNHASASIYYTTIAPKVLVYYEITQGKHHINSSTPRRSRGLARVLLEECGGLGECADACMFRKPSGPFFWNSGAWYMVPLRIHVDLLRQPSLQEDVSRSLRKLWGDVLGSPCSGSPNGWEACGGKD